MNSKVGKKFIDKPKVIQPVEFESVWQLNIREINYFWWRLNLTKNQDPYKFFKAINNNFYLITNNDIYLQVEAKLREIKKDEGNDQVKSIIEAFILHKSSYLIPDEHCDWFLNNLRAALWLGHHIFNERGDILKAVGRDNYTNQLIRLIDMHALWLKTDLRIADRLKDFSQRPPYSFQVNKINNLKYCWFSDKTPNAEVTWLNIRDTDQLDDAIAYLTSKEKLVLPNHFIANNNEEKMAHILASLDYINFFSPTMEPLQPYIPEKVYSESKENPTSEDGYPKFGKQKSYSSSDPISARKNFIKTFKKKYTMQSYRLSQKQSKDQQSVKLSQSSYTTLQTLGKAEGLTPRKMVEKMLLLYKEDRHNDHLEIKHVEKNNDLAKSVVKKTKAIALTEVRPTHSEKAIDNTSLAIANQKQNDNSLQGLGENIEALFIEEAHSSSLDNYKHESELATAHKKIKNDAIENSNNEREPLNLEANTQSVVHSTSDKNEGLKAAILGFYKRPIGKS